MDANILAGCLSVIIKDKRVSVWHIAIYLALVDVWNKNLFQNPIRISRKEIMRMAHVGSIVTYHKCIKELQAFNYIEYYPSYHPHEGSKVVMLIQ